MATSSLDLLLADAELALRLDDLERAAALYERALRTTVDDATRAEALAGIGRLAFRQGDLHGAIAALEESLALAPDAAVANVETLGRAHAVAGQLAEAERVFRRAAEAARARGDGRDALRFTLMLVNTLVDGARFGRAQELLGAALGQAADADGSLGATLTWTQARLHAQQGNFETAARYARRTIELLEGTEDVYRLARAHHPLGFVELELGNYADALAALRRGRELLGEAGNPLERAQFLVEEARAVALLGEPEEAAAVAMGACPVLAADAPHDAARAYAVIAGVFLERGDVARARELYELAADLLEQGENPYLPEVLEGLAHTYELEGRTQEALDLLKRSVAARRRTRRRPAA